MGFDFKAKFVFTGVLVGLFFAFPLHVEAQGRSSPIFVRPVTGGTQEEKSYFLTNIKMEIKGAGYTVVEVERGAKYVFALRCLNGMDAAGAWKAIEITVTDRENGRELLTCSQDYNNLAEMNKWNLILVYQVLANIPSGPDNSATSARLAAAEAAEYLPVLQTWEAKRWRNKWLYISLYGTTGFGYGFDAKGTADSFGVEWYIQSIGGGGISLEFQFLSFLSIQGGADFRASMGAGKTHFAAAFPVFLKIPLNIGDFLVISPFVGVQFNATQNPYVSGIFDFSAGIQLAAKAWSRAGLFVDVQYNINLMPNKRGLRYYNNIFVKESDPITDFLSVRLGIKIGLMDRVRAPQNPAKTN